MLSYEKLKNIFCDISCCAKSKQIYWLTLEKNVSPGQLKKTLHHRIYPQKKPRMQILWSSFFIFIWKPCLPLKSAKLSQTLQKPSKKFLWPTYLWVKVDGNLLSRWVSCQKWLGKVVLWLLRHSLAPVLIQSCLVPVKMGNSGHLKAPSQHPHAWQWVTEGIDKCLHIVTYVTHI